MNQLSEFFRVVGEFSRILPSLRFKPPEDDDISSMGLLLQETAAAHADRCMIRFEGREMTWGEFNRECNRLARALKERGVAHGDSVALFMENRIEYLLSLFALTKLGATAGLINNSLSGKQLAHCVTTIDASACIVGEELTDVLGELVEELPLTAGENYFWLADSGSNPPPAWAVDAGEAMQGQDDANLPDTEEVRAGEIAAYVFTSGTTGLPKAALLPHRKYVVMAGMMARLGFRAKPTDCMYNCLPLYHVTGLVVGLGACLGSGASTVLRRKFSASAFWGEVRENQANLLVYIGELCRYLVSVPASSADADNPLQRMVGNGLRPDVWDEFKQRYRVDRICEIYGASEGNVAFANLLNKDRTIGFCVADYAVVRYDIDADEIIRDDNGFCIPAEQGEPGLLLGKVNEVFRFDGYRNREASEAKLVRDALEAGDCYFNTGDLIREIDVGFAMGRPHYQFVDRIGDTFRWRAENVSTNEVGEILNGFDQVEISNVYGVEVPGAEGRAGMAALTLHGGETFDPAAFSRFVAEHLPVYARPVFLRLQQDLATTQTFKLVKGALRNAAYHLDQVDDPLYVMKPRSDEYEPLDREFYESLVAGEGGY
jgi:citronellyl-CoA synthetase